MALVPISVSATPTPDFTAPEPLGLRALYRTSPLGTIGALGTGMANAALYSMAAVYAGTVGLTVPQIAIFVSANILGGMAFQWPVGRLSDKLDRHTGRASCRERVCKYVSLSVAAVSLKKNQSQRESHQAQPVRNHEPSCTTHR